MLGLRKYGANARSADDQEHKAISKQHMNKNFLGVGDLYDVYKSVNATNSNLQNNAVIISGMGQPMNPSGSFSVVDSFSQNVIGPQGNLVNLSNINRHASSQHIREDMGSNNSRAPVDKRQTTQLYHSKPSIKKH